MAQNGPGFTGMDGSIKPFFPVDQRAKGAVYDWVTFYNLKKNTHKEEDSAEQLKRFRDAIDGLKARGWSVPTDLADQSAVTYINTLINIR